MEYQGKQHSEPVEFFGGEEVFKETVKRDKKKKALCKKNNCELIYVHPKYDAEEVFKKVHEALNRNN